MKFYPCVRSYFIGKPQECFKFVPTQYLSDLVVRFGMPLLVTHSLVNLKNVRNSRYVAGNIVIHDCMCIHVATGVPTH